MASREIKQQPAKAIADVPVNKTEQEVPAVQHNVSENPETTWNWGGQPTAIEGSRSQAYEPAVRGAVGWVSKAPRTIPTNMPLDQALAVKQQRLDRQRSAFDADLDKAAKIKAAKKLRQDPTLVNTVANGGFHYQIKPIDLIKGSADDAIKKQQILKQGGQPALETLFNDTVEEEKKSVLKELDKVKAENIKKLTSRVSDNDFIKLTDLRAAQASVDKINEENAMFPVGSPLGNLFDKNMKPVVTPDGRVDPEIKKAALIGSLENPYDIYYNNRQHSPKVADMTVTAQGAVAQKIEDLKTAKTEWQQMSEGFNNYIRYSPYFGKPASLAMQFLQSDIRGAATVGGFAAAAISAVSPTSVEEGGSYMDILPRFIDNLEKNRERLDKIIPAIPEFADQNVFDEGAQMLGTFHSGRAVIKAFPLLNGLVSTARTARIAEALSATKPLNRIQQLFLQGLKSTPVKYATKYIDNFISTNLTASPIIFTDAYMARRAQGDTQEEALKGAGTETLTFAAAMAAGGTVFHTESNLAKDLFGPETQSWIDKKLAKINTGFEKAGIAKPTALLTKAAKGSAEFTLFDLGTEYQRQREEHEKLIESGQIPKDTPFKVNGEQLFERGKHGALMGLVIGSVSAVKEGNTDPTQITADALARAIKDPNEFKVATQYAIDRGYIDAKQAESYAAFIETIKPYYNKANSTRVVRDGKVVGAVNLPENLKMTLAIKNAKYDQLVEAIDVYSNKSNSYDPKKILELKQEAWKLKDDMDKIANGTYTQGELLDSKALTKMASEYTEGGLKAKQKQAINAHGSYKTETVKLDQFAEDPDVKGYEAVSNNREQADEYFKLKNEAETKLRKITDAEKLGKKLSIREQNEKETLQEELAKLNEDNKMFRDYGDIVNFNDTYKLAPILDAEGKIIDGRKRIAAARLRGDTSIEVLRPMNEAEMNEAFNQREENATGLVAPNTKGLNPRQADAVVAARAAYDEAGGGAAGVEAAKGVLEERMATESTEPKADEFAAEKERIEAERKKELDEKADRLFPVNLDETDPKNKKIVEERDAQDNLVKEINAKYDAQLEEAKQRFGATEGSNKAQGGFKFTPSPDISTNAQSEVDRIRATKAEEDNGTTLNLDGTLYEGKGIVVPVITINTNTAELTPEMIADFVKKHAGKVSSDKFTVGLYKFKNSDQISIDLNVVVDPAHKDAALAFAKEAKQESIFDLGSGEPTYTGESGKEPVEYSDAEVYEIAKSLERGETPDIAKIKEGLNAKDKSIEELLHRTNPEVVNPVLAGTAVKAGNRLFNKPLEAAKEIADAFMRKLGIERKPFEKITKANFRYETAKRLAKAFQDMKDNPNDPIVKEAYRQLVEQTLEQYNAIIEKGYRVEINNEEPYTSAEEMIEDLRKNKRMKIFSTESGFGDTPITDEQRANDIRLQDSGLKDINGKVLLNNDIFRFVHDFFGHAEMGNGFGYLGEENAFNVHVRMYTGLAKRAMTTETRGQNSWVNFSGVNEEAFKLRDQARKLRAEGKIEEANELSKKVYEMMQFAEQKMGLLPEEFTKTYEEVDAERKLADELRERLGKKSEAVKQLIDRQVENVTKALSKLAPGLKVATYSNAKEAAEKTGMPIEELRDSAGWLDTKTNTIHLNLDLIKSNTLYHEGTHPVLNAIAAVQPEAIDRLYKQLERIENQRNEGGRYSQEFASQYGSEVRKVEALTEFIADVADGKIEVTQSNFEKVRQLFIDLMRNLGVDLSGRLNSTSDLKALAKQIADSFNKGEALELTPSGDIKTQFQKVRLEDGREVEVKDIGADIVDGFYSPIEQRLFETKADKQSANKWLTLIGKGDEAVYTGVRDWLEAKNPQEQVSKSDIQNFMKENRISLVEVVKGEDTRYGEYQLAGDKTDYKEVLVTLPQNTKEKQKLESFKSELREKYGSDFKGSQLTDTEIDELQDLKEAATKNKPAFKSTHFDEDNILVHLRMSTRESVDGKKVTLLEENQSDWGQQGKREGFALTEQERSRLIEEHKGVLSELQDINEAIIANVESGNKDKSAYELAQKKIKLQEKSEELKDQIFKNKSPKAPFVTDTNAWTKLGLKYALRHAVETGSERLAWTAGEQQNERYDLSKQVDFIDYRKNEDGTYFIDTNHQSTSRDRLKENELEGFVGKEVANKIIKGEGKTSPMDDNDNRKRLEGLDLKVGGKGMVGFYGSVEQGKEGIIGGVAKALVKELTGKQGEIGETKIFKGTDDLTKKEALELLKSGEKIYTYSRGVIYRLYDEIDINEATNYHSKKGEAESTQLSIEITPELKAAVENGMPLFQKSNRLEDLKQFIEEKRKLGGISEESLRASVETIAKEQGIEGVDALFSEKGSTFGDPKAEYDAAQEGLVSSRAKAEAKLPFIDKYFKSIEAQLMLGNKIKRIC